MKQKESNSYRDSLTNQQITDRFDSSFDLCRHSIDVAKHMMKTEEHYDVEKESKNIALEALEYVASGEEYDFTVPEKEPAQERASSDFRADKGLLKKNNDTIGDKQFQEV